MNEDLLHQIHQIRERNNDWWIALIELAIRSNPTEAKQLMHYIENNDRKITELWKSLRETLPD